MLTVQHEFARMFEDFVRYCDQAHRPGTRLLSQIRANGINGVSNKDRLDKAKTIIAVAERGYAIICDQPQAETEDKSSSYDPPAEDPFFLRENLICNIG